MLVEYKRNLKTSISLLLNLKLIYLLPRVQRQNMTPPPDAVSKTITTQSMPTRIKRSKGRVNERNSET